MSKSEEEEKGGRVQTSCLICEREKPKKKKIGKSKKAKKKKG